MARAGGYGIGVSASTFELALLGVGAYFLVKELEKQTNVVQQAGGALSDIGSGVGSSIGGTENFLGGQVQGVESFLGGQLQGLKQFLGGLIPSSPPTTPSAPLYIPNSPFSPLFPQSLLTVNV